LVPLHHAGGYPIDHARCCRVVDRQRSMRESNRRAATASSMDGGRFLECFRPNNACGSPPWSADRPALHLPRASRSDCSRPDIHGAPICSWSPRACPASFVRSLPAGSSITAKARQAAAIRPGLTPRRTLSTRPSFETNNTSIAKRMAKVWMAPANTLARAQSFTLEGRRRSACRGG